MLRYGLIHSHTVTHNMTLTAWTVFHGIHTAGKLRCKDGAIGLACP